MHRSLERQLKKTLGIGSAEELAQFLQTAQLEAEHHRLDGSLTCALRGMAAFLERVDASYEQLDRDLALRSRSLEVSSAELIELNQRLRVDIAARNRAIDSLNNTVLQLMGNNANYELAGQGATENIEFLSAAIAQLVGERELQRRKADNLIRAIDEHAVVSIANVHDLISYANDKFCAISGYSREELIGARHSILKSGKHDDRFYQNMWQILLAGKTWHGELCNRRKNGDEYWVTTTIIPLMGTDCCPYEYIAISTDISKQKQTEQILACARDTAEAASRSKSEFVSVVSHELRTPLTAINGALGLLNSGMVQQLSGVAKDMVEIALKNTKRLTFLINDLLDMEKLMAGKMHFDLQRQQLMPLVEQAINENQTYAQQHQVQLSLIAIADVDVIVDAQRILQVLANLLSNAAKFSPANGVVEVAVLQYQNTVRVEVIDHGPGIPDEFKARIFQKFSQADSSDTRQKGGTGLGLAISQALIERMGGKLAYTTQLGLGCNFFFELPLSGGKVND